MCHRSKKKTPPQPWLPTKWLQGSPQTSSVPFPSALLEILRNLQNNNQEEIWKNEWSDSQRTEFTSFPTSLLSFHTPSPKSSILASSQQPLLTQRPIEEKLKCLQAKAVFFPLKMKIAFLGPKHIIYVCTTQVTIRTEQHLWKMGTSSL